MIGSRRVPLYFDFRVTRRPAGRYRSLPMTQLPPHSAAKLPSQDRTQNIGIVVRQRRNGGIWLELAPVRALRKVYAFLQMRTDTELLYDGLPEPIDLELDLKNRLLYWTDRGDPPRGNTVNRAPLDADARRGTRPAPDILLTHLMEGIGIALDIKGDRMFLTDLAGSVYSAGLDGSGKKTLLYAQGNLTGIAYADVPHTEK